MIIFENCFEILKIKTNGLPPLRGRSMLIDSAGSVPATPSRLGGPRRRAESRNPGRATGQPRHDNCARQGSTRAARLRRAFPGPLVSAGQRERPRIAGNLSGDDVRPRGRHAAVVLRRCPSKIICRGSAASGCASERRDLCFCRSVRRDAHGPGRCCVSICSLDRPLQSGDDSPAPGR